MKNLNLLSFSHASIPDLKDVQCHFSLDVDTDTIYLSTSNAIVGVDVKRDKEKFSIGLSEVSENSAKVVALQYVQGDESICAALSNGDLCLINVITKTVECVGTVDSGLVAMKWSPDQEIVLLGTGHDSIIAMTRDFDPLTEVNLFAKEFGQGEFITVGWGKKETQFHGTEGKGAAKNKMTKIEPTATWDDKKIRIAWRGDGQYFAVSMIDPLNFNRKFCVWNRECVLQYTSENINGLESAFAWKPSGSLLASSQRKPHRHDIVFFEKNGLQHGELTLPFAKDEVLVKKLEWNADSSILLIWMVDHITKELHKPANNYLQLWTISNYHWYLKQSFRFSVDKAPSAVQWDPEHSNRLHVISVDNRYRQYAFSKTISDSTTPKFNIKSSVSAEECDENFSYVAVIDGESVLMTPFSKMVVPPPMCAFKLTLPHSANAVCFLLSKQHPNDVCVVLNNSQVAIYKMTEANVPSIINEQLSVQLDAAGGNGFSPRVSPHKPAALLTIQAVDHIDVPALHHWLWVDQNVMFAISPCSIPGTDLGMLFIIDYDKAELCLSKSFELDGLVLSVYKCSPEKIAMQLSDGRLVLYDMTSSTLSNVLTAAGNILTIPRPCMYVSSCTFGGTECTVALSENSRIYINETEVASDCSSFCVHNDFLFLTTHAHSLKCIDRNISLENVLKYYNTPAEGRSTLPSCAITETHRAIERGSRIVTVTPGDSRLILQMPRGNLEQIHPRCLVLSLVSRHIKSLRFSEAFAVMKKHRINMNLLCDVDRELFEKNIERFVNDLDQVADINIFISDLHNDDFTTTMYKQYFSNSIGNDAQIVASGSICPVESQKVNKICDLLLTEMLKDLKRFIMPLITAHVKKNPSEVGHALARIKEVTECPDVNEKFISHLLKYMTVLVESNQLFDEALGTYDFKLVMMVAEKSEKDPKEYMPILNELNKLEENYRKYEIDLKLKRYSKALQHIAKCEDYFHECVQLIEDHSLYKEALEIFAPGTPQHKKICSMYGTFLQRKQLYNESGIIFTRCEELRLALECFVLAANCSLALSTAYKLDFTKQQIVELSYKLAEQAKNTGLHEDAVDMLENYASDVELAVEAALDAHMWSRAMRMTAQHRRSDLDETHVEPALRESCDHTCQMLNSYKVTFIKHTTRLQEVRQNKERLHMQMLYDGCGEMGRDSDLYSDTSSTAAGSISSRSTSNVSRTTGKSSKSRRRKERRDYSLKEGSRFEDLALLRSLKLTAKSVNELCETVRSLSISLASFGLDHETQRLQNLYSDVCSTVSNLLSVVWSQKLLNGTSVTGVESTVNSILSSVQNRHSATGDVADNEKQNYEDANIPIFQNLLSDSERDF